MKSLKLYFLLLILIVVNGCQDKNNEPDPDAVKYINEVVDAMEKWSINRKTIDWTKFRGDVVSKVTTSDDINNAIKFALTELNDHHSFMKRGEDYIYSDNATYCPDQTVTYTANDKIGYIRVNTYSGNDNSFATDMQNQIKNQDNKDLIGWIVDLRSNLGGNMWPMLAGIGPVLGEGTCGHFIDPDDKASVWQYANGSSILDGSILNTVASPYKLINENPKVAVLLNEATGSSGEAIAVAFINRPNTRSFGKPTCGLSTANAGFPLSDGALLQLTVSVDADRNKNKMGGKIQPDENIDGAANTVNRAVQWLKTP